MTGTRDKDRKVFAEMPARASYEVGYAKPPKDTRFKPGQSGNPRGRPKGAKNKRPALNEERMKNLILDEAYRTIKVREGDRHVTIPVAQAVIRSIAVNAAKNRIGAQRLFSELLASVENSNKALQDEWLKTAIEYKLTWEHELERRRKFGIDAPDPIPHPDHIEIDMRAGEVVIKGPLTKEEDAWARQELIKSGKIEQEARLAELQQRLIDDPNREDKEAIESEIAVAETVLWGLRSAVPD